MSQAPNSEVLESFSETPTIRPDGFLYTAPYSACNRELGPLTCTVSVCGSFEQWLVFGKTGEIAVDVCSAFSMQGGKIFASRPTSW